MTRLALILCSFSAFSDAFAWNDQLMESVRFRGRGGTFVAGYDSDEATRGNPATLAEAIKIKFQIRYAQLDGFANENSAKTVTDLFALASKPSGDSALKTFSDKFGKRQFARAQFSPLALRFSSFEIMPFMIGDSMIDLRNPPTPEIRAEANGTVGGNFSFGYALQKTMSLGITVRPLNRWELAGEARFQDLVEYMSSGFTLEKVGTSRSGFGVGVDVGGIWIPALDWRLGMTIQNVGDTGYFEKEGGGAPSLIKQIVSIGGLYRQKLGAWTLDYSADLQDLLNVGERDFLRLFHFGAELGKTLYPLRGDNDLGLVAGLNEGYLTLGAFADLWLARVDYSTYAVELGEYASQRPDRIHAFSVKTSSTF